MRSRYNPGEPRQAHFVTCTIVEWLPVLGILACREALVDSFIYCCNHKGLTIYAWVILENHFHAILQAEHLAGVMRDLKKFTAKQFLEILAAPQHSWLLKALRITPGSTQREGLVWQTGYHPQEVHDDAMMEQKIDYINYNPVRRSGLLLPSTGDLALPTNVLKAGVPSLSAIRGARRSTSSAPPAPAPAAYRGITNAPPSQHPRSPTPGTRMEAQAAHPRITLPAGLQDGTE